ncbi:MAG: DUF4352 domain-containing protein [Lachnospiraceae bacterium]|nr:DUF4352 domain-containing protein [Lachnospiraceae bacterium]
MEVEKKSVNGLGIASLAFGIVGILTICGCGIGFVFGIIGIILGILGLTVLRNSGKGFPIAGLIISGIAAVFGSVWVFLYIPNHRNKETPNYATTTTSTAPTSTTSISSSSNESTSSLSSESSYTSTSTEDLEKSWEELQESWNDLFSSSDSDSSSTSKSTAEEDAKEILASVKTVGINEEFGNKTITGKVTDVDYDYKNYNDVWTTVPDDKKCVYIKIKVTNISNDTNYVSVGDFNCYVDDIAVDPELVSGGSEPYNENIDPGRSAILGALYVVPKNASSIELEYNPIGEYSERVIIKIL